MRIGKVGSYSKDSDVGYLTDLNTGKSHRFKRVNIVDGEDWMGQ
jgi:hypothetical protein